MPGGVEKARSQLCVKAGSNPGPERWLPWPAWSGAGLLILCTLLAYLPAMRGQFVWDDDSWTTNIVPLLRDFSGLRAMWCDLTALQQYFPLTGTTFWIDYHLWGFWTLPYHVENVLLHALAALLVWRLLIRLRFRGAWLVAAIFALHPVMVESAAWITERKNVLSLSLYLAALLAYGRFNGFWEDAPREDPSSRPSPLGKGRRGTSMAAAAQARWWGYGLALALFLAAMLAKTTAFSLPPALLLLGWWKRGRLCWRADILPTLPLFTVALGLGCVTSWVERHHVGTGGAEWAISLPARCLIAGHALWFYTAKLFWPGNLCFVYPRWNLNPASLAQWWFPASAAVVVLALWMARTRIGRGPVTAVLFFIGTLSPLLGFINGYFMRYSFVCDHWTYLSSLGLITLAVGLLDQAATRFNQPRLLPIVSALVLPVLGALTWRQAGMYRDMETLWRTTLARNPKATMAQISLGNLLYQQGHSEEAVDHFEKALALQPDSVDAHSNLGAALLNLGRVDEAIAHLRRALEIQPSAANAHNNLGNALLQKGQVNDAVTEFQRAVELAPTIVGAHYNLGAALLQAGRAHDAEAPLQRELELQPDRAEVCAAFGLALLQDGRLDEAMALLRKAVELQPGLAQAHIGLGNVLLRKGLTAEAEAQFQQALSIRPDLAEAHFDLAGVQLQQGHAEPAVLEFQKALAIEPNFAPARNNLGSVLLSVGRVDEAITELRQALKLQPKLAEAHNNLANAFFRKGQPKEAVAEYEAALAIQNNNPQLLNNLAWALATCPEASVRNGVRAIDLAQRADQLAGSSSPQILGTLAAAWAEAGKFTEATTTAQRALELATAQTNATQVESLRTRLRLYQSRQPFRDQELRSRENGAP